MVYDLSLDWRPSNSKSTSIYINVLIPHTMLGLFNKKEPDIGAISG